MTPATFFSYHPDMTRVQSNEQVPNIYNALVALEQGRITERDVQILEELASSHFLTWDQLAQFAFQGSISRSAVQRRLKALDHWGLVSTIRWTNPTNPEKHLFAYGLTLNGALLLRQYYGRSIDWKPGMGKRHLKVILSILTANQLRLQLETQQPQWLYRWRISTRPNSPVASFRLGSAEQNQLFLLETPRDSDEVAALGAARYTRWEDENPVILTIAPTPQLALSSYQRLQETVKEDVLVFSTDERALEASIDSEGYIWRWQTIADEQGNRVVQESLSLV